MKAVRRIFGGLLLVAGAGLLAGTAAFVAGSDSAVAPAALGGMLFTTGWLLWKGELLGS